MSKASLQKRQAVPNDELYTQYKDIEDQISHYTEQLAGKTIYCNCDNYSKSNFFRFFEENFRELKLKKLIATHYAERTIFGDWSPPVRVIKTEASTLISPLKSDGDYRSLECVKLLKQSDIIITNPPFSKLKHFIPFLFAMDKKFLIIGSWMAYIYTAVFPYYFRDELKISYRFKNGRAKFLDPYGNKVNVGACWYTNLECNPTRHLIMSKKYDPKLHPKYDNYDIIEVSSIFDVPCDYPDVMGVPITFAHEASRKQFELIGTTDTEPFKEKPRLNGRQLFQRLMIKNNNVEL